MTRFHALLCLSVAAISLSGCTLTPPHFDGYDLLDTGYKAENQDPVRVPVKEDSDRPWIKTSTKKPAEPPIFAKMAEAPAEVKEAEKAPEKKIEKVEEKPAAKMPEKKPEKTVEKKVEKIPGTPVKPADIKAAAAPAEVKKTEEKKVEKVAETKPVETKPVTAPEKKSAPCGMTAGGVAPPPPPPGAAGPNKIEAKRDTLRSGDKVKITVFREKDLTGEYQINDKGMITFPMLGQVQASNLKSEQLQSNLVAALSKGFLVKPEVNVEWSDCNSK